MKPPVVLCLFPPGSPEKAAVREAVESLRMLGVAAGLAVPGGADGDAVTDAIVIGDLSSIAALGGGSIPPAALIPVLSLEQPTGIASAILEDPGVVWCLTRPLDMMKVRAALRHAMHWVRLTREARSLREQIGRLDHEVSALNRIGIALSAERDADALLGLILTKCREITAADAGSLYLVEEDEWGSRCLVFKLAQNDTVPISLKEARVRIDHQSLAGHVAMSGKTLNIEDVYDLPAWKDYTFNRSFDEQTGYRTRSVLVVPMTNQKDEILGVVQLINRRAPEQALPGIPFDERCVALARSLASQAAVALENARLYAEIRRLFDGFVRASVTAIESRDPTTSGHSSRVATLSVALAETINRISGGPLAASRFGPEDLRELHYATLLHDFGKIGVREQVLLKGKKLYPHELRAIQDRFRIARLNVELAGARRPDPELAKRLEEIDRYLDLIGRTNEPSILDEGDSKVLAELARLAVPDAMGGKIPLLSPEEAACLSVRRGSLTPDERLEIESHVTHTYQFLSTIPWTRELRRVPAIAHAHHEKLDGSGYPLGLKAGEIPILSRIMTVCDIFDALTARDRPYKRAIPCEKALAILETDVREGRVDGDIFRVFVEARIFERVASRASQAGGGAAH
ncbi:MAG TPA: HD domain-containing phosphohydrolase [Candidatus Polarisedimenticolia bacterium]|jgi:HD-GYP domain-containing protein (c-di-GMP phosphodiesterase class II)